MSFFKQSNHSQVLWNISEVNEDNLVKEKYHEYELTDIQSLASYTIEKNQSLIIFMPYESLMFDQGLDL